MKLLFLAPQPFFQERGTPIAVRLALTVLAERNRERLPSGAVSDIDLLTYHEGQDVDIPGVRTQRIRIPSLLRRMVSGVGPGVSIKKLLCDVFFLFAALKLVWKKRKCQYDIVHAVEEGVFVALLIKLFFGIPYIYDMDSSLAMQVTEKWPLFRPLYPLLAWLEKQAVRRSMAVVPVCDALGVIARNHGAKETVILRDISLIDPETVDNSVNLRAETGFNKGELLALYVGNLEPYQGIDLLLNGFAQAVKQGADLRVVIIGGSPQDCEKYRKIVAELGLEDRVRILGPRPVSKLGDYILQADILLSPRIKGNNTPMKIYSYLHSGKAIIATNLPTHTQVLHAEFALLFEPNPAGLSEALCSLAKDPTLRASLGARARELAAQYYTFPVFSRELNYLYDRVSKDFLSATSTQSA